MEHWQWSQRKEKSSYKIRENANNKMLASLCLEIKSSKHDLVQNLLCNRQWVCICLFNVKSWAHSYQSLKPAYISLEKF